MTIGKNLDKITVKGFKSIKNLESLELNNLNILIGANGAGKSNFIEIFHLLRVIINKRLQEYVLVGGGSDGFLFNGPKKTKSIHCHFCFDQNEYQFELISTIDEGLLIKNEEQMYVPNGKWETIAENSYESNLLEAKKQSGVTGQASVGYFVYGTISSWVVYHFHDTSIDAPMRRSKIIDYHQHLYHDAANIAPFLLSLQSDYYREYQEIVDAVRIALPFFDDFLLTPLKRDRVKLRWIQKGNDYPMQPYQFSDGAIRFICLATALLQPDIPSTIVIDEPELGLHPEALALLAELIHAASKRTQVIVATQSPYLVNHFSVEDLIVVNRRGGQSVFERLNKEAFSEWFENYSVGDLWTKNIIEAGNVYE